LNTTNKAILEEYKTWLGTLGYSETFIHKAPLRVGYFLEWLESKNVAITELNQKHVIEYFTYLEKRPNQQRHGTLSVNTLNSNFYIIDKLLECLHQIGLKNAPSPTKYRITPNKLEQISKINPLSQKEVKELYNNIKNSHPNRPFLEREKKHYQLKLVFALHYACGLRRMEGQRLTLDDINFDNRTIFVKQGKNYKDRIIPMSEGVYRDLQDYIYNFRNRQKLEHKRLLIYSPVHLLKSLKNLQEISGNKAIQAKTITLHLLRHSIATHLMENGMAVESIAKFLGHSSLQTTQFYTHIVERK